MNPGNMCGQACQENPEAPMAPCPARPNRKRARSTTTLRNLTIACISPDRPIDGILHSHSIRISISCSEHATATMLKHPIPPSGPGVERQASSMHYNTLNTDWAGIWLRLFWPCHGEEQSAGTTGRHQRGLRNNGSILYFNKRTYSSSGLTYIAW